MVAVGHEQTHTPRLQEKELAGVQRDALKRRGSLPIWFDPAMIREATPIGKRGRQPDYSDAAIPTCLTMRALFGMAMRQTTGFAKRLLHLIGLDWAVPDFSTLSRPLPGR